MKKALSFISRHRHWFLAAGCFVVAGLFLMVPDLMAQGQIVNIGSAENNIKSNVGPIVAFVRKLLAFGAVVLGIFEAFKAAKGGGGGGKGWMSAITLFFVAALLFTPGTFFGLLGMSDMCTSADKLQGYGICDNGR